MKVALSLTHRCNLSCRYCYSGKAFKKDMSFATAQKIVDFAVDITPPGQRIEFGFFGGEPLLRSDLMKEITSYIREQEREARKPVRLSITTNGTLLTQPILDFFKEENVDLCISIDGPAHVHNLNRCYKDGQGSFDEVVRTLHLAMERLGTLQVNAVYGPDTIDFLLESVSFFTQLGVSVIHLNPNICASWGEDTYSKLQEFYMQIADHYIQSYQYRQEIAVNLIDSKIIVLLKGGYEIADKCGMGETEWGFAPSGNIYPCERLIGEDNDSSTCLGNIHTGLDLMRRCSLLKQRGNHNEECKTCDLQKYCMNWCGCTNYYMTGHTNLAGPMICESEKAAIQAAKHVLITLKDNELFLDHFMKYLHEGRHYQ
ncbi:MAG: radical SAM protein [Anaerolineae bacterium]